MHGIKKENSYYLQRQHMAKGEGILDKRRNPVPAVDFIITKDDNSKMLLVRRKNEPFRGVLSIPGGFINEGETVEDAMRREAKEETSLVLEPIAILGVYSDPNRDPKVEKNCKQLKLGQTTYWPS